MGLFPFLTEAWETPRQRATRSPNSSVVHLGCKLWSGEAGLGAFCGSQEPGHLLPARENCNHNCSDLRWGCSRPSSRKTATAQSSSNKAWALSCPGNGRGLALTVCSHPGTEGTHWQGATCDETACFYPSVLRAVLAPTMWQTPEIHKGLECSGRALSKDIMCPPEPGGGAIPAYQLTENRRSP